MSRNYMSWNYMSRNYMKCYWAVLGHLTEYFVYLWMLWRGPDAWNEPCGSL